MESRLGSRKVPCLKIALILTLRRLASSLSAMNKEVVPYYHPHIASYFYTNMYTMSKIKMNINSLV